jgi:predicted TIM-barrel fold metal-dependent hydrolase
MKKACNENHEGASLNYPIPVRIPATDETAGQPQTPEQQRVQKILLELADRFGPPLGMNRRSFLKSCSGMAAAFLAMNSVFGGIFTVNSAEAEDPQASEARRAGLKDQFIFDVQTHFVRSGPGFEGILALRSSAKRWNPDLKDEKTTPDKIGYDNYIHEIFEKSDTKLALLSSAPSDDHEKWFLHNDEIARARKGINEQAGSKRLFSHAVFTPGRPGWMEDLDRAVSEYKPDSWKGYTIGTPFSESKWPWRLDDEKLVYPAYEKMQKAGIINVCIHKGLLPSDYKEQFRRTWQYAGVGDLGKAAKDWPGLNFMIYHSAIRRFGVPEEEDVRTFEEKGYIPWVSDLAQIPEKFGVKNVYAELGSVFAMTALSNPRYCSGILGTLVKGMGADKVLWGTDSVFYGSPQWQIEAFRRIEIPEDLRKKLGFEPLGPADSSLKSAVLGKNAARVYGVKV